MSVPNDEPRILSESATARSTFQRVALDLKHPPFSELAFALRERSGNILKQWREISLKAMPHFDRMTLEQFENSIAKILSTVADAMQSEDVQELRGLMEEAPAHGFDRFIQEMGLLDYFEEERILRGVIIIELHDSLKRPLAAGEAATFHAIFDIMIQQGAMALIQKQKEQTANLENERRELAARFSEHTRIFDRVLSSITDFAYTFDLEGRFTFVNKPLLDLWGLTLDEAVGKSFSDLNYPDDLAIKLQRQIQQVIDTRERVVDETPYTSPTGAGGIYQYIFTAVLAMDGTVEAVAGSTRDITGLKQIEETAAQLAAIVTSSEDAIISKDVTGLITSWNRGAERLFGYSAGEIIGKPLTLLIPAGYIDEEPRILARIRRGEVVEPYETVRRRRDGTLLDIWLTVSPLKDASGRIIGASKIARDITERKRTEERLRQAKEQAEHASHAKDKFLAVLSHELRTPLTPVVMTIAALEMNTDLPLAVRDDLRMIRRNVELETKLIDDLLDITRITSGKLRLRSDRLDINEVVLHVSDMCRSDNNEKGIRLHCDLDEGVCDVIGDAGRLHQVFWNLLKNAAKFTPAGGDIYITTQNIADSDIRPNHCNGQVRVTVRDTGMGIAADVLPHIFEAFEQGDLQITRQFGGLGLGLAIAKMLVEQHRGSIRALSDGSGTGATFVVELPIISREVADQLPEKMLPGAGGNVAPLRLLLVEDHVDTAKVLSMLLKRSGHAVMTATNVSDALSLADKHPFDIIITDIGLPDATGYELMEQIREKHRIKGIAMSGYGMEEDIRRSERAGFSEHLVKPVAFLHLEEAVRRVAAVPEAGHAPGVEEHAAPQTC